MNIRKHWLGVLLAALAAGMIVLATAAWVCAQPAEGQSAGASPTLYRIAPGTLAESDSTGMSKAYSDYLNQQNVYDKLRATPVGRTRFGGIFLDGGIMMWPLLAAMIVGIVVILERLLALWRPRISSRPMLAQMQKALHGEGVEAALHSCERSRGPFASILQAGLTSVPSGKEAVAKAVETTGAIQMSYFHRGLTLLATLSVVAPLFGFLGSLSGLTNAYYAVSDSKFVSGKLVTAGLSEAVITIVMGLVIAIPAALLHRVFTSRADHFIAEMEEMKAALIKELGELGKQRASGEGAAR